VLGADGLSYFLQSALGTVMDLRVQLSSCVPARHRGPYRKSLHRLVRLTPDLLEHCADQHAPPDASRSGWCGMCWS
jgi:hypothetical protein